MRRIAIVILLLSAALFAETQEAAYFRAMQAEESGDIAYAINCFEEALAIDGEYTEEISEILNEYYDALNIPANRRKVKSEKTSSVQDEANPWSFHFFGELSGAGVRYSASKENSEWGAFLQASVTPSLEYSAGAWVHSFGVNLQGNLNFNNENVPALDTNDWKGSFGVEYSLIGERFLLDVGVDLNLYQQEDLSPAFYSWLEYIVYKKNNHKVGVALWSYYDVAGPLSLALYGTWRKTSSSGFGFSVMAGPRFETDSSFDYRSYVKAYENALDAVEKEMEDFADHMFDDNPYELCSEFYGDQCYGWDIATLDSINWYSKYDQLLSNVSVVPVHYWSKWLGPSLKARTFYKFKNGISLEAKMNLFYSFVVDGPDSGFENVSKFSGIWTGMLNWRLGDVDIYLYVEDSYKMYSLPKEFKDMYPKHSNILKFGLGSKWDF